jgi:hypothetical protein
MAKPVRTITNFELAMNAHKKGKDPFPLLKKHALKQLHDYQNMGVKKVQIYGAGNTSCQKCRALNGKILTIPEALETMPIPVSNCDNDYGYCRCIYLPTIQ